MVAAAVIGGAVIGGVATSSAASSARSASRYGANTAAQAQYDSTAMQVAESRRQFDLQMELLGPMLDLQFGAVQFFGEVLGFGSWDAESGTWSGGGPASMGFGAEGGFFDPNLNPDAMGAENWQDSAFGQYVLENQLAGTEYEQDLAVQRAEETQFGTDYRDDPRYQRYLEQGDLVGQEFESSPGYQFQLDEAERNLERRNSAGGQNYGGRVLQASQERAMDIADQDYYNWLDQRRQDLARGDRLTDVATADARRREEINLARGDAAMDSYFGRREGDISRGIGAINTNQQYLAQDRQRQDQGYYNFLNMLMGSANSGAVNSAVGAAGQQGAQNVAAYRNQGNNLSSIWENFGNTQANINMGEAAGWNNAIQGGISNWMFADYAGMFDQPPSPGEG